MSMVTHDQMRDFIASHDFQSPEDVQRALKRMLAGTLQAMLTTGPGFYLASSGGRRDHPIMHRNEPLSASSCRDPSSPIDAIPLLSG